MLTGIAIFKDHAVVGITPGIWSEVSARYTPHASAIGVIFSGQKFCRAQSQNCETKNTHARPARKTGGDFNTIEINLWNERLEKK
jgi:hypothetical protein